MEVHPIRSCSVVFRSVVQVLPVLAFDHPRVQRCDHVDTSGSQSPYQAVAHRIFIEVQTDCHAGAPVD
jgi:hypothetical protein